MVWDVATAQSIPKYQIRKHLDLFLVHTLCRNVHVLAYIFLYAKFRISNGVVSNKLIFLVPIFI